MNHPKSTAELIAEGRALLAASYAVEDLLPLDVDRLASLPLSWPEGLGWFVCDRNGLGWASSRNDDKATAELIVLAINRLPVLFDMLTRVEKLTYASDDGSEYEHDHGTGDGHAECPACWAEDIRRALAVPEAVRDA